MFASLWGGDSVLQCWSALYCSEDKIIIQIKNDATGLKSSFWLILKLNNEAVKILNR